MKIKHYAVTSMLVAAVCTSANVVLAEEQPMQPSPSMQNGLSASPSAESGGIPVDDIAATGARQRLASAVNSAVTLNGYQDFVGSLSKADRERLNAAKPDNNKMLNDEIERLRKAFQDRYGQNLSISENHFRDLVFIHGADEKQAIVTVRSDTAGISVQGNPRSDEKRLDKVIVSEKKADGTIVHDERVKSTRVMNPDLAQKPGETPAERDARVLSEGQRIRSDGQPDKSQYEAKVNPNGAPGQQGVAMSDASSLPPARLTLVREELQLNPWRIDAPDALNAGVLEQNLSRELSALTNSQASWPEDINKAERMIAIHVFRAMQNSGSTYTQD